jgi:hypothetical protein
MTVRGVVIDVNDGSRVATTNGRQKASPKSFTNASAGDGDILCHAAGVGRTGISEVSLRGV